MTSARLPRAALERPVPPAPVSFEEFLAWCDEDTHAEWVAGEIVLMSPASFDHQFLVGFFYDVLKAFVTAHQLGVVAFGVLMRLPSQPSGREPDLLFVSSAHADRLRPTYLDGPADLVVEIISPDSHARDRVEKLHEYEQAGIPEYWLVDPPRQEAFFYQLGADGRYQPGQIDPDGDYRSRVLAGLRLGVAWLWQRPLPSLAEISAELGV